MTSEIKKIRLSKRLAACGIASRRAAEELIFAGKVSVNGEVIKLPQTLVGDKDKIFVDGKPVGPVEKKLYFMLHKPSGYICSKMRGSARTKLVLDLFEGIEERLFTVGRLDKETEGLILVTNDGHFANQVIHPSRGIVKEYLVKTDADISDVHLKAISHGTLVEGVFVKPVKVTKVRNGTVKVSVTDGKKHEVRHLMAAAGLNVRSLSRIRIGGLVLGTLEKGAYRELTEREKAILFQ